MKYLTLIRHAKSRRDETDVADHDRDLAERGLDDCPTTAKHMASAFPVPDRIVTSSAKRAVRTIDLLLNELEKVRRYPDREIEPALYLADAVDISRLAEDMLRENSEVWICAHNPGITETVGYCTRTRIENVPTLGIVRIAFEDDLTGGEVIHFDTPKNHR